MAIHSNTPLAAYIQRLLKRVIITTLGIGCLTIFRPSTVDAADVDAKTVGALFNWYYATTFGTGVYTIDDAQVSVLSIPISYQLREPDPDHWAVYLTVPTSVAIGNFDLYDPGIGNEDDIHLAAWSLLPGIEARVPLTRHWRANPFINIGWAKESRTGNDATVYQAGISTLYELHAIAYPEIEIGGKYVNAGYKTTDNDNVPVSLVSFGIDARFPTSWTLASGRKASIGLHWIGTHYLTEINFLLPDLDYTEIHNEQEIGISFGVQPAVNILGAAFDRIGLGYITSSNGLTGIRLVTGFEF